MKKLGAAAMVCLMAGVQLQAGGPDQARFTWEELRRAVEPRKGHTNRLRMTTAEGARIEADILSASPEGLQVNVRKTSNRKLRPKGQALLKKDTLQRFDLVTERSRPVKIGTVAGLGIGAAIGVGIVQARPEEGIGLVAMPVGAALVTGIGALVGYSVGRALRWHVTEVTIVP